MALADLSLVQVHVTVQEDTSLACTTAYGSIPAVHARHTAMCMQGCLPVAVHEQPRLRVKHTACHHTSFSSKVYTRTAGC